MNNKGLTLSKAALPKGWKPLSSNAKDNWVLMIIFAIGAVYGISEEMIEALVVAALPIIAAVIEIIKGLRKPVFAGNVITYLISAAIILAPWASGLISAIEPIVLAVLGDNFTAIWPLLIPLVNQLVVLFQTKPWKPDVS